MHAAQRAFAGKRVFITGHTGFKGAWLCEWLLQLGAEVHGYSLPPPTQPALFEELQLASRIRHREGDVRDATALDAAVADTAPDFVFHLAAQSLVRRSYADPIGTLATNVMGTANLLHALRSAEKPCAVVVVTSDKCYDNHEAGRDYREGDVLGGRDPYSASKAAAEIVTAAWRDSFYSPDKIGRGGPPVAVASARAGNVIGGGDWAADRLMPDCVRALRANQPIVIRNPDSVRPWQHVLEPLSGYLELAAQLHAALSAASTNGAALRTLCSAFNFGPALSDHQPVRALVDEVLRHWPGKVEVRIDPNAPHEARLLHLSTEKAERVLNWKPRWHLTQAVEKTVAWYRSNQSARARTQRQIASFSDDSV